MKTIGALAFLLALLSMPACVDESCSPPEQYCDALCDGFDWCWEETNHHSCVRDCLAQPWLESASEATLAELAGCIEKQSCKKYLNGTGFEGCWQDASNKAVPAEQCRVICEAYALQVQHCGDQLVVQKALCLDLSCDLEQGEMADLVSCAEDLFSDAYPEDRFCDAYPSCANTAMPDPP